MKIGDVGAGVLEPGAADSFLFSPGMWLLVPILFTFDGPALALVEVKAAPDVAARRKGSCLEEEPTSFV